jgi:hypothetical protein
MSQYEYFLDYLEGEANNVISTLQKTDRPGAITLNVLPNCTIAGDTSLGGVARFSNYQTPLLIEAWGGVNGEIYEVNECCGTKRPAHGVGDKTFMSGVINYRK